MASCAVGGLMYKNHLIRCGTSRCDFVNVPYCSKPVLRVQQGVEIWYRWEWSGLFDRKLKTVWRKQWKDWEF